MNTALSEMLHSLTSSGNPAGNRTDASMLERQQAQMKWQQEQLQQQQRYLQETDLGAVLSGPQFQGFAGGEVGFSAFVNCSLKVDPGLDNGWTEFGHFAGGEGHVGCDYGMNSGSSRTTNCTPAMLASTPAVAEAKQILSVLTEKTSSSGGREGSKKRKADKNQNLKAIAEEDAKQKRVKESPEVGESKITEQNSNSSKSNTTAVGPGAGKTEVSGEASKENSKVTDVKKPDYIHVRARRGQATDSHSLAERVRREKISERMKFLQDLVPGCNKITGKAGMLDEIINYVQSLQRQVEFLSMKLAAVDPTLDFNIDNFLAKEVLPACQSTFPLGMSSEMNNPAFLQFNPIQQALSSSCNGLEMAMEAPDLALKRTISAPVSIPESFLDSSCFNYIQASSNWETSLQSLYGVNLLPSLQVTGSSEVSSMKMEM